MSTTIEDEKLILFGWIVTILGIEADIALSKEWRNKTNKLVDKMHELGAMNTLLPEKPLEALELVKDRIVPVTT